MVPYHDSINLYNDRATDPALVPKCEWAKYFITDTEEAAEVVSAFADSPGSIAISTIVDDVAKLYSLGDELGR